MDILEEKLEYIRIKNQETIALRQVPVLPYVEFRATVAALLDEKENHCVNYYAYPDQGQLKFIACIADDKNGTVAVLSHEMALNGKRELNSLSNDFFAMHIFER